MSQKTKIVDDQMQVVLAGTIYVQEAKVIGAKLIKLIDKGQTSLLIDLSQVDYIDSFGLGMLVSMQKLALESNGGIKIKGIRGCVKKMFEVTRLTEMFEIQQ